MSTSPAAASSTQDRRTVLLHVGCRKSGTSGLQRAFKDCADDLLAAGLEQPLGARGGTMSGLVDPLRESLASGDDAGAREAVASLARLIADSPSPRHLISLEALAELPADTTRLVVEGLSDFAVEIVVTARPWALTIPSEWQQLVKSRFTRDYVSYARGIREQGAGDPEMAREAEHFRRRQDVADITRRWRAADPELPVHVVWVPQSRHAEPDLTALFCQAVGIERSLLQVPDRVINPSISYEDAEVLRMVNLALGDRLADTRGDYRHSVRKWVAVGTMMKGSSGARIRLPRELDEWARDEARRQVADIAELGVHRYGDEQAFVSPDLPDDDFTPAADADIARAAAAVIADLAVSHDRDRRAARRAARKEARERAERRRRQRERQQARAETGAPSASSGRLHAAARLVRRAGARVRR